MSTDISPTLHNINMTGLWSAALDLFPKQHIYEKIIYKDCTRLVTADWTGGWMWRLGLTLFKFL